MLSSRKSILKDEETKEDPQSHEMIIVPANGVNDDDEGMFFDAMEAL